MKADLEQLPARQRRFTRYFTLTHLFNAGLSEDELQSYRHGLAKLVNSLSWGGKVDRTATHRRGTHHLPHRPARLPVGEQTWEEFVDANPYGVLVDSAEREGVNPRRLPAAIRPVPTGSSPLRVLPCITTFCKYLPPNRNCRTAAVDVAENIRQERIARAGFQRLRACLRNNRLIERHEANGVGLLAELRLRRQHRQAEPLRQSTRSRRRDQHVRARRR